MMRPRILAAVVALELSLVPAVGSAQTPASTSAPAPSSSPASAAPTPAPSPDAVKEAEVHFHHAVDLYKESDYGGALVEFRRAYDLAPNYRLLFNLGQTYFQLQRWADALRALQDYLAQGGSQVSTEKRASVEADVRNLQNRVGQLEVKVNIDGAQIAIDDQAVGTSPLAQPLVVSVGHRKASAAKAGLPTEERFVDVTAGDHATVVLEFLTPQAATGPAPSLAPAPAVTEVSRQATLPPPPASHPGKWIAWGATALLGAGTAVTGVLALAANSRLSDRLDTFPGDPDGINSARTQAKTFGVVSDALLGATVVAGVIAIVLTATDHGSPAQAQVGFGPSGIQIQGRY
ncbi:MAG TPA: tetratricopeptide repeat protein [Polyangiaceae bacterium]|nr:tetratricopeptide repeat protein [Polyangiaceae bacterium]